MKVGKTRPSVWQMEHFVPYAVNGLAHRSRFRRPEDHRSDVVRTIANPMYCTLVAQHATSIRATNHRFLEAVGGEGRAHTHMYHTTRISIFIRQRVPTKWAMPEEDGCAASSTTLLRESKKKKKEKEAAAGPPAATHAPPRGVSSPRGQLK